MKKIWAGFAIAVVLIMTPASVRAQEPTPTPGNALYLPPNARATTKLQGTDAIPFAANISFGFGIDGLLQPIVNKVNELLTTDMQPFVDFKNNVSPLISPSWLTLNKKIIPYDAQKHSNPITALYAAILTIKTPWATYHSPCFVSTNLEATANIPWSQEDYQQGKFFNTIFGRNRLKANDQGEINFNLPTQLLKQIDSSECGREDQAQERTAAKLDVTANSGFSGTRVEGTTPSNLLAIFGRILDAIKIELEVSLTRSARLSNDAQECHNSARCAEEETDSQTKELAKTGGWTAAWIRNSQVSQLANLTGPAGNPVEVKTPFKTANYDNYPNPVLNKAYVSQQTSACAYTPRVFIDQTTLGGVVPIAEACGEKKPVQCPIDVIAQQNPPSKDQSCNLCNAGSYTSSNTYLTDLEKQAFPEGIPPLLTKVLKYVGGAYHVPPAVLLGTMLEEGAFEHAPTWTWTDETVKQFSDCAVKSPMPSCDTFAHPTTGAKGPFGYIQNWWDNYMTSGGPYKAVENDPLFKEVLANRPKDTIGPCNFLDAAFMAARELGEDQSHLYVSGLPGSCTTSQGTVPVYQGNDRPASCSVWQTDRVVLSRLQYGDRVCDGSIDRLVRTFSGLNCSGGQ